MRRLLENIPFTPLVVVALTLGLAPFVPEPHIWQKIKMLISGELVRPLDMFDLLFHGSPWILLGLKLSLARPED